MVLRRKGKARAFTLIEVLVTLVVFSLFSTALVAVLQLCLRYWFKVKDPTLAEQDVRMACNTMVNEFHQACINPNSSNASPYAGPSNFHPSQSFGTLDHEVTFWEVCSTFDASIGTYNPATAANYQCVDYQVGTDPNGNTCILRTVYTPGTQPTGATTGAGVKISEPIVSLTFNNATALQLNVTGVSALSVDVQVLAQEQSEVSQGGLQPHVCEAIAQSMLQQ